MSAACPECGGSPISVCAECDRHLCPCETHYGHDCEVDG